MTIPGSSHAETVIRAAVDTPRAVRHGAWGSAILLGCAVGLLGLALTLAASRWLGEIEQAHVTERKVDEVARMSAALKSRMDDYEAFARTVAGLFAASENVSADEWERFVDASGLHQLNERGAMGVVYAPRVEPGQRAEWEAHVRDLHGQPATIRSDHDDIAFPVAYFAPGYSPLGLTVGRDLLSGAAERDAVMLALAVKRVVLSAPTRFGHTSGAYPEALLIVPLESRVARFGITAHSLGRLEGVIGVVVDYREWIGSVLGEWQGAYAVELSDPSVGRGDPLMMAPLGRPQVGPAQELTVAGRRLVLRFFSLHEATHHLVETTAVVAGGLLSLGLGGLTCFLLAGRARAQSRAARVGDALADSERRFALALSATSDGIWEWVPGRRTMFLSARGRRIVFGHIAPDGQFGVRRVLGRLPGPERAVVMTAIRAHLKQRTPLDVEVSMPGKDGARHYLRLRGQAQWDALGAVVRLAGAVSDVTALRRREADLERTQQFYARVLEILPQPVFVKSREQRYLLCNKAACEFTGMSREALLSRSTGDLLPGQSAGHTAMDEEVIATGGSVTREFHVRLLNGREGDVIISKAAATDPDGHTVIVLAVSNVTAQRRAEDALRSSLAEFDGLFRHSPLGMAMVTKHGLIRRANAAFARIVGIDEAALVGRTYRELTPPRFHALDREKTIDALRSQVVTPYERAFLRPDGTEVPVVLSGAVVRVGDGEPGVWTVVEDISERKAAEAALRRVNATQQSILDALPDDLVQFDARLNLTAVHCRVAEALPLQPDARVGSALRQVLPPTLYEMFAPLFVKVMTARRVEVVDYHAVDGKGDRQHYEARVAPVSTGGVLVVLRNTTERQKREAALRESESRFRLMADAAPVMIWVADEGMQVTYVNRRWLDTTGSTLAASLGAGWLAYVHPDDVAHVTQVVSQAGAARAPFELACRVRRADGTFAWLMVVGALRYADSGEFAGFIGCGTDVTEVRQAHQELRRHRDHLAELVSAQTASVLSAKEAAERASEAKSLFLANMSHELRSPMHAILSYARLGEQKCPTAPVDKTVDYFQRIRSSGERLLHLLNDLLDLSKLEARRMVLERKAFVLPELVGEILREQEGLCIARRIELVREVLGEVPEAFADPLRMGQVLRNLVSNAIRFSPDGGKIVVCVASDTIRVGRCAEEALEVPALQLVVSDEGPGVPADELETVFDKFVQSSKTRNGAGGTGLGLAICKEIVEAHGGTIRAQNGDSGGARFVVLLPARTGRAPADPDLIEEPCE